MATERTGSILLISSPQNSKNADLKQTDLLGDQVFRGVVGRFDQALGLDLAGSLDERKQIASVVMSVAAHNSFLTSLKDELAPGYLFPNGSLFKTYLTGHSIGEMACFIEGGIADLETMARILEEREKITSNPVGSGVKFMLAVVGLHLDQFEIPVQRITEAFGDKFKIALANKNSPREAVFAVHAEEGTSKDITRRLTDVLAPFRHPDEERFRVVDLKLPTVFHSPFSRVYEPILIPKVRAIITDKNFRRPEKDILYSPMLGDWIGTRSQALNILFHQLTRTVDFRQAMLEMMKLEDIVAIITADIKDVMPRLAEANMTGARRIPVLNIKDSSSLHASVEQTAELLDRYKRAA